MSPSRLHKLTTQGKSRYFGKEIHNGVVSKQDGMSNGIMHPVQSDAIHSKAESKYSNLQGKERVMHLVF